MPEDLIDAGFDLKHGTEFLHKLMLGHCTHMARDKTSRSLQHASMYGQTPRYASIGDTTISPTSIFRSKPARIFHSNCPGGIVVADDPNDVDLLLPRSTQAAAHYAAYGLNVRNFLVLSSGNSDIVPYIAGDKELTGSFMKSWTSVWEAIVEPLKTKSQYQNAQNAFERYEMVATELTCRNADRIEQSLLRNPSTGGAFKIIPAYFDPQGTLTVFDRPSADQEYSVKNVIGNLTVDHGHAFKQKAFGCSCCDSRALHSHIYYSAPGDFHELYAIAAVVPDHREVLNRGTPNSAWLQIELAKTQGCTSYVVTGHTKCGGVAALVAWCLSEDDRPQDSYIAGWLLQAKPIVESIVEYAHKNGFDDNTQEICRLTEMYVTQWSATNIKRYVGQDAQVLAHYLDIETRELYPLPLHDEGDTLNQRIEKTYNILKNFKDKNLLNLSAFYEVPARLDRARRSQVLESIFV